MKDDEAYFKGKKICQDCDRKRKTYWKYRKSKLIRKWEKGDYF